MPSRLLTALAATLAAALLSCAPALASSTQESIIQDDTELLEKGPAVRDAALDDIRALGADTVRALVFWHRIAPAANSRRTPSGFDARNPAAYPAEAWDAYDDLVHGTTNRGLDLLLVPSSPVPRWAAQCRRGTAKQLRVCKPDPAAYGDFVAALATRYSGTYRDENHGNGVLPRVDRWAIWNEPNQPGWLYPQYERRGGRTLAVAAHRYRSLARSAIAALRATGHGRDQILLGETAPLGRPTSSLGNRAIAPVTFLRELFCISARGRRLSGTAARIRGCRRFARLRVTGYAHHPYTRGASVSPSASVPADWITLRYVSRLTRLLDQGARAGRVPRRLPVHYTEYGFQTRPPDRIFGVPLARQAEYLNRSDFIAYRTRRVRSVAQYKLNDDRAIGAFQTGLRFADGRRKPSWDAYRLPLYVVRSGSRALVYGQVRPADARAALAVEIQWRRNARARWRVVARRRVTSERGHFTARVGRRSGEYRLRWRDGGLVSRVARVAAR